LQIPPERTVTQVEIPARTIMRVILVFVLLWLINRVWNIMLLGLIALMFAAALDPLVRRLQSRGVRRSGSVAIVMTAFLVVLVALLSLILSPLITEGRQFIDDLPSQVERLRGPLRDNPEIYNRLMRSAQSVSTNPSESVTGGVKEVTFSVISFLADALVVLVFTIYFLLDGPRIYRYTFRYVPQRFRRKLDRSIPEVSAVVSGYVTGQFLTSLLFGIFAFAVLSILGVPQPLFLALLAALGDAVPIVGVTAVTIPTVFLALTVSPTAAIVVLIAYIVYQQVENYFIVPRVYQSTLNISSFAVLIAVLIGSALLGIVGALLALPIAAAIPVIEDIWLEDHPIRANLPPDETAETAEPDVEQPIRTAESDFGPHRRFGTVRLTDPR
jgi:predicted PurR-regulated permease PerM